MVLLSTPAAIIGTTSTSVISGSTEARIGSATAANTAVPNRLTLSSVKSTASATSSRMRATASPEECGSRAAAGPRAVSRERSTFERSSVAAAAHQ
ncbi:hypothetical protein [Nonomuraea salmonea]|uniref:hypothetical protein n=1 Tax=Nonomuraea salmonea TaxID=46181 RepID=UPI002FE7784F